MKSALSFIILFIGAISCGTTNNATKVSTPQAEDYKSIATDKMGEDVEFIFNGAKSYVLCVYQVAGTAQQPRNNIYYLVIKLGDNSIMLENRVNGGTVSWYNQKMIQVYKTPRMIRKDQSQDDFITLYNVETGKSYPKNQKETH